MRNSIPFSPMDYYFFRRQLYTIQYIFEYDGRLDFALFEANLQRALDAFPSVGSRMKFLSEREIALETGYPVPLTITELETEIATDSPTQTENLIRPIRNAADEPLLRVHITYTPRRTFIGFSFSHMLADGKGTFHFLSELSSLCRGEAVALLPVDERGLLRQGNGDYAGRAEQELFRATGYVLPKPSTPQNLVLERIFYSRGELEEIRAKLSNDRLSQNDIVMADLAKRFHRHIPLHEGKFIIRCPVDYRKILGLPETYFGNAVRDAVAIFDPEELAEMETEKVALRIRQAIQAVDQASVRSQLQCLNALREEKGFEIFEEVGCPGLIVTNWTKFPVAKMDFGLGPPQNFYHASINPRLAIILPTADGVEVRFKRPAQYGTTTDTSPRSRQHFLGEFASRDRRPIRY